MKDHIQGVEDQEQIRTSMQLIPWGPHKSVAQSLADWFVAYWKG